MTPRTVLLIDSNQITRRQRVVMLLTQGYVACAAERVEDLELPFVAPGPDLVLLRADQASSRSDSAYVTIRNAAPGQKIGFVVEECHELCQVFLDGRLVRPRKKLAPDLLEAVAAMFKNRWEAA